MKTLTILGAGQFGRACLTLINQTYYRVTAFGDNDHKRLGNSVAGVPVLSVRQALAAKPDMAMIGVRGEERAEQLWTQARALGYTGKLLDFYEIYTLFDVRGAVLVRLAERLREADGEVAELGVYQGETAKKLNALFPNKKLHLFDTFEGFDARDVAWEQGNSAARTGDFADTGAERVLAALPHPGQAVVHKGFFPETARGMENERYALVSLDADLYAPTLAGLDYFYPRLCRGGAIVLHDYNNARFRGVKQAVDEYEQTYGRFLLTPLADVHGTAVILRP